MATIGQWLNDNRSWLFDGVGVAVLLAVGGYILNRLAGKKEATTVTDAVYQLGKTTTHVVSGNTSADVIHGDTAVVAPVKPPSVEIHTA